MSELLPPHASAVAASVGAPDLAAASLAFSRFCQTIAALRDKKTGCPWDLQQDHQTLRRYMLEEAYEACEAMGYNDAKAICDELGDVLLQVVLNAQIAHDGRHFNIVDVINAIDAKMRRRHPHVFGTEAQKQQRLDAAARQKTWEQVKTAEKAGLADTQQPPGFFSDVARQHPASRQALKIGKRAAEINFDWDRPEEVFAQVRSEIDEVEAELQRSPPAREKLAEEIGDVYFSLAQFCRHLGLDPEVLALSGNQKFLKRFGELEALARHDGIELTQASRLVLEDLWQRVKKMRSNA